MGTYPRTIDNGHGESLTFLKHVQDGITDRLEVENRVQPGAGPPLHAHYLQEEAFTVMSGRLGYEIQGESPRYLEVGESASFARGVVHRFWNAGDTELLCSGY